MRPKPEEANKRRGARAHASASKSPQLSREPRSLLSAQNHILSTLAAGCTIPQLMSEVADYLKRFAPSWEIAIHLVDPVSGRLSRGISKTLGRRVLRALEQFPLSEDWPVGLAFATGGPWRRPDSTRGWAASFLSLEHDTGLKCTYVTPAHAPKGDVVAVVTAFHSVGHTSFEESPQAVLDVASSILGMGVDRIRTVDRLLLAQSSIDNSGEPTVYVRADASFIYVNEAACDAFGYSRDELLGMRVWELDANVSEQDFHRIWDIAERRNGLKLRTEVRERDDRRIPVEIAISCVEIENERFQCAVIRNISALRETEKRLQDCEERYALAAKGANDGLWNWELAGEYGPPGAEIRLSPRWCALMGLEAQELHLSPDDWWRRIHPDDVEAVRTALEAHLAGDTDTFEIEHRMIHAEGRYLWVLTRGEAERDEGGTPSRIAGSLTDITKQKLAEERLRHDAMHDDLTGLPNRAMFMDHLGRVLERARRSDTEFQFAVLFLDFDRFKRINDSLGHLVGDQLLIAIARRLSSCVRPADTVARLGGDEFSILLDPALGVPGATRVAERIHQALREPFRLSGLEIFITASVGIALGSRSYERPEDILRDADTAMYRAKAAGKARHEVFDEAMHARAIEQLKLEAELRLAVKRREFCLLYQPVVSLVEGGLVGIEAFARWEHPRRGLLAPASFLPVAEESGLIVDIGWWIFREACRQMKAWQDRFRVARSLAIHVNVSGKELFQPELPERIEAVLAQTGLRAGDLVLDVPENVIMHQAEASVMLLSQLKSLGLKIHLDDFGTGYSSLGYLHRFQIDTLKIDHSFIRHLRSAGENWKTVRAIVTLAENLGMDVIAEGVENEEQLEELRKLHCTSAQGSLFAGPQTRPQMEAALARREDGER